MQVILQQCAYSFGTVNTGGDYPDFPVRVSPPRQNIGRAVPVPKLVVLTCKSGSTASRAHMSDGRFGFSLPLHAQAESDRADRVRTVTGCGFCATALMMRRRARAPRIRCCLSSAVTSSIVCYAANPSGMLSRFTISVRTSIGKFFKIFATDPVGSPKNIIWNG